MFLTKLHNEIKYKGQVWYFAGTSISDDNSEIYYQYCNHTITRNGIIYGRTKDIKFISFRFKMQLRKRNIQKSPEQMKRDIFNQINNYRKKHGVKV